MGHLGDAAANAAASAALSAQANAPNLEEPPLFLRKTHQMIDTCPTHLGGWSATGDTFLVYDADTFARAWIPRFFRHNKFSSFVRQLNFYGFRKVKSDEHGLRRDLGANGQRTWEFRHDLFKKGRPELMKLINRRRDREGTAVNTQQQDVAAMRTELAGVKRRCADLERSLKEVHDLVAKLTSQSTATHERIAVLEADAPGLRSTSSSRSSPTLELLRRDSDAKVPLQMVDLGVSLPRKISISGSASEAADEAAEQNPSKKRKLDELDGNPDEERLYLARFSSWGSATVMGGVEDLPPAGNPTLGPLSSLDIGRLEDFAMHRATSDIVPDVPDADFLNIFHTSAAC